MDLDVMQVAVLYSDACISAGSNDRDSDFEHRGAKYIKYLLKYYSKVLTLRQPRTPAPSVDPGAWFGAFLAYFPTSLLHEIRFLPAQ